MTDNPNQDIINRKSRDKKKGRSGRYSGEVPQPAEVRDDRSLWRKCMDKMAENVTAYNVICWSLIGMFSLIMIAVVIGYASDDR